MIPIYLTSASVGTTWDMDKSIAADRQSSTSRRGGTGRRLRIPDGKNMHAENPFIFYIM